MIDIAYSKDKGMTTKIVMDKGMFKLTMDADGNVHFIAGIDLKITTFTVSGDFNIVDLITACSGLLCQAARLLKGRNLAAESELQRIMGY